MILLWTEQFLGGWVTLVELFEYPPCFWGHGGKWWSRLVWSYCIHLGELQVHALEFPSLYNSGLNDRIFARYLAGGSEVALIMLGTLVQSLRDQLAHVLCHRSTGSPFCYGAAARPTSPTASMDPLLLPPWGLGQAHVWLHNKGSRWNGRQTWLPGWPPSVLLWVHFFFWIIYAADLGWLSGIASDRKAAAFSSVY